MMGRELLDLVVAAHSRLNDDTYVIDLVSPDGAELPPFEAGAHVEVHVAEDVVRPYSLCNNPALRDRYRLGVLHDRASRGGSAAICTQWRIGQAVQVGAPRNLFPLARDATRSVLIGAGIGITPMIAMAHQLQAWDREFEVHYCVREAGRAVFLPDFEKLGAGHPVHMHFSANRRFAFARDVAPPAEQDHLYVCGPQRFMNEVIDAAAHAGWRKHQIHFEYFDVETDTTGAAFTVELSDGRQFEIGNEESIAEVLMRHGFEVDISCEKGICGSCIVDVTEGTPDHRDHYLTDEERAANDCIVLCCSRSKTALIKLQM